ncbi:MAG TPA: hypothetical protein VLJ68_09550 [Chitinophagaceae bacterium]|nr:hypothetical protein [Chitinophagaceae bacterium]
MLYSQSLTGLYTGVLTNDSSSVRKDQYFEIVLTEYRGKVSGYSRSEFIVNDTLYYIVKRVKGVIDGDKCEVKDDEIVSFNFPTKLDKGVKVTSTFYRSSVDSIWRLGGKWTTNQTKKYYKVTGQVDLKEEKDLSRSKLFPHLEELNLADEIIFYKERKKLEDVTIQKTVEAESMMHVFTKADKLAIESRQNESAINIPKDTRPVLTLQQKEGAVIQSNVESKTLTQNTQPELSSYVGFTKIELPKSSPDSTKKTEPEEVFYSGKKLATPEPMTITPAPDLSNSSSNNIPVVANPARAVFVAAPKKDETTAQDNKLTNNSKIETIDPGKQAVANTNNSQKKIPATKDTQLTGIKNVPSTDEKQKTISTSSQPVALNKPSSGTEKAVVKANVPVETNTIKSHSAIVAGRKSDFAQTVMVSADSLELALYDNGEIDGDTVSVFLNGEVIMPKQGLKASAIKKTIYMSSAIDDEITLVLYAENLGKYPPNTGLLVVHDGEEVYNIRFSADLQKNAAVIFRRKK